MRRVTAREEREAATLGQGAAPLHAAALAAGLLAEAWHPGPEPPSRRASVTRDLALGLRVDLEELAGPHDADTSLNATVEGALRAADVSNLAAASLADLPEANARRAAAAAHLAAGAARALCALIGEAGAGGRAGYASKDARSAAWRAGLAARQADEALEDLRGVVVREA